MTPDQLRLRRRRRRVGSEAPCQSYKSQFRHGPLPRPHDSKRMTVYCATPPIAFFAWPKSKRCTGKSTIAYLRNPPNPVFAETETQEVQTPARALGQELLFVNARRAFTSFQHPGKSYVRSFNGITVLRGCADAACPRSAHFSRGWTERDPLEGEDGWLQVALQKSHSAAGQAGCDDRERKLGCVGDAGTLVGAERRQRGPAAFSRSRQLSRHGEHGTALPNILVPAI